MWIENISYLLTFAVTAGISALGIMLAYQLYQENQKAIYSTLMYQQIFLFSFLFYGVWGNIALRVIIGDLNISDAASLKLAVFVPMIGIPFMVVSWFMLLKFAYNLNGYKFSKTFTLGYFPGFVLLILVLGYLIKSETLSIPQNADLFVVRILISINLLVHLFFLAPFYTSRQNSILIKETGFERKWALLFLGLTTFSAVVMSFFNFFGFISSCIALVFLFASGVFLPLVIRIKIRTEAQEENQDFQAFCKRYDISNREAEIILEICSGKSNKDIAEKLFITLQTVKDHNHRIYSKTGVKSRVQLANLVHEKTTGHS